MNLTNQMIDDCFAAQDFGGFTHLCEIRAQAAVTTDSEEQPPPDPLA